MPTMKVLLIEDDPTTQLLFQMVMSYHEIPLMVTGDRLTALEALKHFSPNIIVVDIFLPETNGYKLLSEIRSTYQLSCPAIATTAFYTTNSLDEFEEAGFDGYLSKPLELEMIVPYLQQIVARH